MQVVEEQLNKTHYLLGDDFTAADIMCGEVLTTAHVSCLHHKSGHAHVATLTSHAFVLCLSLCLCLCFCSCYCSLSVLKAYVSLCIALSCMEYTVLSHAHYLLRLTMAHECICQSSSYSLVCYNFPFMFVRAS